MYIWTNITIKVHTMKYARNFHQPIIRFFSIGAKVLDKVFATKSYTKCKHYSSKQVEAHVSTLTNNRVYIWFSFLIEHVISSPSICSCDATYHKRINSDHQRSIALHVAQRQHAVQSNSKTLQNIHRQCSSTAEHYYHQILYWRCSKHMPAFAKGRNILLLSETCLDNCRLIRTWQSTSCRDGCNQRCNKNRLHVYEPVRVSLRCVCVFFLRYVTNCLC